MPADRRLVVVTAAVAGLAAELAAAELAELAATEAAELAVVTAVAVVAE
ncbi:MAG: hypothetical protein LC799_33235 [Actinobacteria bacterium]|nr:hypothetical protein [Actinomycetota bacterium]